jgi:hypothetical protein
VRSAPNPCYKIPTFLKHFPVIPDPKIVLSAPNPCYKIPTFLKHFPVISDLHFTVPNCSNFNGHFDQNLQFSSSSKSIHFKRRFDDESRIHILQPKDFSQSNFSQF